MIRAILIISLVVIVLSVLGAILPREKNESALDASARTPVETPAKATVFPYHNVVIDKMNVSKDGLIFKATFTLKNNNIFDVKDIEVRCDHTAKSGTVIDHNIRTIYEIVKAHGTKTVRDFNMGFINSQAVATQCQVTDARFY